MLDDETLAQQHDLLATYRRTLARLLTQAAQHGGEPFAPPEVANGIDVARAEIRAIKERLHASGAAIDDWPGDTPSSPSISSTS